MTEETKADEPTQGELLFRARRRGIIAFGVTALLMVGSFFGFRGTGDLVGTRECKASSECEGVLGVECLHAPTGNYCTHTCNVDGDCDPSFRCDSPPWEKGATRLICLRPVPPAKK